MHIAYYFPQQALPLVLAVANVVLALLLLRQRADRVLIPSATANYKYIMEMPNTLTNSRWNRQQSDKYTQCRLKLAGDVQLQNVVVLFYCWEQNAYQYKKFLSINLHSFLNTISCQHMFTFKMPVAFPTGTFHVIQPGYLDAAFWGKCASRSTTTATFSSFARSTRRLSPSWNLRNDALASWSLWAATTQYAPPTCCSDCKDFLTIMCRLNFKREEQTFYITSKKPYRVLQVNTLRCISTCLFLCFLKQCVTTRCDLVHKDFSYTIRYYEALKVNKRDNV